MVIYQLFLWAYRLALQLVAPFNPKARLWINGRRNWQKQLKAAMGESSAPLVWMHCASLGEFEQGRPLLEFIRLNYPHYRILISFFSPSGYEIRKQYNGADIVCYLPLDGAANAKTFIDLVQPKLVLWIRYEFWYHYLTQLRERQIPVLLVSALFRGSEPFFKWYGALHRKMLRCFSRVFVQDNASARRLKEIGAEAVEISGDTRYDRVSAIAEKFERITAIEQFIGDAPTLVAGSTWPEDEEELDHYANTHPNYRFILAPHEIAEAHLKEIEALFKHSVRYSDWVQQPVHSGGEPANTLVIDNIGLLSKLYHYATVAYIGGGFGDDGLHNILEAAVYGVPVVHGPVYEKFPEAIGLIEAGGAFAVDNALELEAQCTKLFEKGPDYVAAAAAAANFVQERKGATAAITTYIQANRLLTN
jgi:3-deoxy-D-manno-octulosonic-acid transferase